MSSLSSTNYMIQYINNVSIILIENHMYSECYDTYKDAIDFMKTYTSTLRNNISHNDNDNNNNNDKLILVNGMNNQISDILDNATQRLCLCMQQQNQQNQSNNNVQQDSDYVILDINNNDSLDILMKLLLTTTGNNNNHNHNNNSQNILLRTDHPNHEEYSSTITSSLSESISSQLGNQQQQQSINLSDNNNNNIDFNYAILLYNYGIVCQRYEALIQKQNQMLYDHNGILIVVQQQQQQQDNNNDNDDFVDELLATNNVHSGCQLLIESLKSFESSYKLMIYPLSIILYHINHNDNIYNEYDELSISFMLRIVIISTLITMNICTLSYNMCLLDIGNIYYTNKYQPLIQLLHILYNEYKKNHKLTINNNAAAAA